MSMYILTLYLFIIHLSLAAEQQVNFCKKDYECSDGKKNTICQLEHNCGKGPKCKRYTNLPLSDKEKKALLDIHNKLRNDQALGKGLKSVNNEKYPTAANMLEMVWDKELEFSAQCWANQCPEDHDTCRRKSGGIEVGQNLAYNTQNAIEKMVKDFYGEASNMPVALIDKFDTKYKGNGSIGHFTQLVFWNSSQVGCGRSKFFFPMFKKEMVFLACNYAWAGNWNGQAVYKKGKPCSACPKGSKCHKKYKGLCTTALSKSKVPSICKFSEDKNCKPILRNSKKEAKDKNKKENKETDNNKKKGKKDSDKDKSKGKNKDGKSKDSGEDKRNGLDKNRSKYSDEHHEDRYKNDCKNADGVCIIERKIIVVNSSRGYFRQLKEDFLATIFVYIMTRYIN